MTLARHLVSVWNPTYATDALDAHLRVLLEWDAKCVAGTATDDDAFVWWGKVKSSQRQQRMPHLHEVLALDPSVLIENGDGETHLYLTDYRSLYVADVDHITVTDPRVADSPHVPAYYAAGSLNCDCWFMLRDIRLLVRDDLEMVAAELAHLKNTRYYDRAVSLYGGMVDLPLIVSRADERRYFHDAERDLLTEGRLWAAFDGEQGGTGAMEATMRDNHFGPVVWQHFSSSTRQFIASAETIFRNQRRDPAADLSGVLVGYAKALEVELCRVLTTGLRGASVAERSLNIDGKSLLLPDSLPLSLGIVARAIYDDERRSRILRTTLTDGNWLVGQFSHVLADFAIHARNPAAHASVISRELVTSWRAKLLGVGESSQLLRLACITRA